MKKRARWKCPVCGGKLASNSLKITDERVVWFTRCNLNLTHPIKAITESEALDLFYETYKRDE